MNDMTAVPGQGASLWDLSDLYANEKAWAAEYAHIKDEATRLAAFEGTLGKNAGTLLKALDAISRVNKEASRLYTYAGLKGDEDLSIAKNQERRQQAGTLYTLIGEKTAWLAPEILKLGPGKIEGFAKKLPALISRHGFFLDNILRAEPHTLGVEAESVLAAAGDVLQQPDSVYHQLANSELPFPTVTLSDGTSAKLDQSGYVKHRQCDNRADRKLVFDAFWGTWKNYEGTHGAVLTTHLMGDLFRAKTRKHKNALSSALFPDNMPEAVYRTLVAEANRGLPTLHRYFRQRQRFMKIEGTLEYFDVYPPTFSDMPQPKFTVADSERITLEALAPYGDEYLGFLKQGFAGKWTDIFPRAHKASGAYMNGSAYDVHPYVLLNHLDDYDSLSTFAHEWGHAVHTLLTSKNQPYEKSHYSTFTAEAASIANEMLLNDHLVSRAKSSDEKLFYLAEALESIRGTFFRQTMLAEFELKIHEELEDGRPLSGARMTELYGEILRRYYGEAEGVMKIDPAYAVEWAFIPHFFYNFYVYQYATSIAAAAQFTDAIVREGQPAAERFLALLSAGGSDYPYELYKRAGIDMASPAPYEALVARMNRIMDEIESLRR